jgi:hypothetical protein
MIKERAIMVGKEQVPNNPEEQDDISQYEQQKGSTIKKDYSVVNKSYKTKPSKEIVGLFEYLYGNLFMNMLMDLIFVKITKMLYVINLYL